MISKPAFVSRYCEDGDHWYIVVVVVVLNRVVNACAKCVDISSMFDHPRLN